MDYEEFKESDDDEESGYHIKDKESCNREHNN
jgi:hypothetical protein